MDAWTEKKEHWLKQGFKALDKVSNNLNYIVKDGSLKETCVRKLTTVNKEGFLVVETCNAWGCQPEYTIKETYLKERF